MCPADTKMGWVAVCALREVGREPVRHSLPDGTDIVLIRHGGRLLAMSNSCPHKKASLHRSGDIEDLGGDLGLCLRCPKHKSKFGGGLFVSFATGKCTTRRQCSRSDDVAAWAVPTYQTKEEDGVIFVRRLAEHAAPEPAPAAPTRAAADEQHARLLAAKLLRIRALSPDSDEYTLQLVEERDRAAFAQEPAAMWHLWLAMGGVSREYTPTSTSEDTTRSGLITLVIKLYSKGEMSDQLARAAIGDLAAVSPPRVTLRIPAFDLAPTPRGLTFNLLAGGTGVAPCLQFLRRARICRFYILGRVAAAFPRPAACVQMLYSCWTLEDALLAAELEDLAASWPERGFRYAYVLTREKDRAVLVDAREPKRSRTGGAAAVRGRRIDAAMMREHLVDRRQDAVVMTVVSGPSGFNARCEELVRHNLTPEERGEVVVLDA